MGCLEVPEILLEIFEFTFALEDGHRNLAALARTCRTFYEPAVSLLWHTQSSLAPLIFCFPPDLLDISRNDPRNPGLVRFTRSPGPQDWERPLRYAPFIRAIGKTPLEYAQAMRYIIPPRLLETLAKSCPIPTPLRRLETFDDDYISFPGLPSGLLLVTNSEVASETSFLFDLSNPAALRKLKFTLKYKDEDVARTFLTELAGRYACMESLHVMNYPIYTNLKPCDYLIPIGSLQHLTSFALSALDSPLCTDLLPKIPDTIKLFPAIRELSFCCSSSSILPALKVIYSSNLRTARFDLRNHFEDRPDELCAFITSHAAWQQSLQSISIASPVISIQAVESLLELGHLRHVSLSPPHLDDNILEHMAQAWPALEHLDLAPYEHLSPDLGQATLNSLASFSRHCPHLIYLRMQVKAHLIPPLVQASQAKPHNWLRLVFHPSSIILDPVAVAQFLLKLSPHITLSIPNIKPRDAYASHWERVVKIMGARGQVFAQYEAESWTGR